MSALCGFAADLEMRTNSVSALYPTPDMISGVVDIFRRSGGCWLIIFYCPYHLVPQHDNRIIRIDCLVMCLCSLYCLVLAPSRWPEVMASGPGKRRPVNLAATERKVRVLRTFDKDIRAGISIGKCAESLLARGSLLCGLSRRQEHPFIV